MNRYLSLLFIFFLSPVVYGQPQGEGGAGQENPTAAGGPASINLGDQNLFLEVLEDFEDAEDWVATSTTPLGITKTLKIVQRGEIRAANDDNHRPPQAEAYSVVQNPDQPNHVLGVKTYFNVGGGDRVELTPPHELKIKGMARQFSIWMLGRNFNHSLFLKVRDYRGKIHKLKVGPLNFYGWRKMTVVVPGWLPQSRREALFDRNLHFVSLYVMADYHEPRGNFYFYIDGLKVLVDRGEPKYPGSEIEDSW